ncbi:MAG TPA: hypothetical protein VF319_00460 [Caldimonas sp.]
MTIAPTSLEPIEIRTHRALLVQQGAIAARVAAQPDLAVMLLINPVLAFERMGVKMSAEIASHVLHTIQYPKAVRERRDVLEATLKKALGEPARPTDPVWNVHLLFELRKLAPLLIGALVPQYKPPIGEEESKPLQALRPAGTRRYTQPRLLAPRSRVGSVPWKESLRRMDLDTPAPKLEPADSTPLEVPLEDLWFYKDLDAIVHDALELGIIQRRAFPIHTPDSFRQILDGSKHNAFRLWIRSLRFKTEPR